MGQVTRLPPGVGCPEWTHGRNPFQEIHEWDVLSARREPELCWNWNRCQSRRDGEIESESRQQQEAALSNLRARLQKIVLPFWAIESCFKLNPNWMSALRCKTVFPLFHLLIKPKTLPLLIHAASFFFFFTTGELLFMQRHIISLTLNNSFWI